MCIPCMAITVGIVIGAVCLAWLAVRLSDKLTKLRNRPVHDTETDGRIDDSGLKE